MARKSNEEIAKEKGITVEQLLAEREANKAKKLPGSVKSAGMSFVRDCDKVATLAAERAAAHAKVDADFDAKQVALGGEIESVRTALYNFAAVLKVDAETLDAFLADYQKQRLDRAGNGEGNTK